jgi:hypothetical protein
MSASSPEGPGFSRYIGCSEVHRRIKTIQDALEKLLDDDGRFTEVMEEIEAHPSAGRGALKCRWRVFGSK